ncbi:phosphopyruvate hydratase [Candidatus Dependentiae bacterium]|nr:phosphopyruvate hydratase [Candidatus Dependentiae bacterium]
MAKIVRLSAREILDSRGCPTLESFIELSDGRRVSASVPAGASVGRHEAHELRDILSEHYHGKGVQEAVRKIEKIIAPLLVGKKPDLLSMDHLMIQADGTQDKSNLGANTLLVVSIAVARAHALVHGIELFEVIAQLSDDRSPSIPQCMFNILNGGMHGDSGAVFQEFMIMPFSDESFEQQLQDVVAVYQQLKALLKKRSYEAGVGDEGGFTPHLPGSGVIREREALDLLMESIMLAGFDFEYFKICLDVAASCFYDEGQQIYTIDDELFSAQDLVGLYEELTKNYPIYSIEDGMSQDDWAGWKLLTDRLGDKVQLVGDDLFTTNVERIKQGIDTGVANAVLIKPNQIGTVSQALQSLDMAHKAGYKTVVSHRSGETSDTFIIDLAVGAGADQCKAGACSRGERVAKYNRLLQLEELLK